MRHRVDVRAFRQKLGLTQEEFALRLSLDRRTVQRWETGAVEPSPLAIFRLRSFARELKDGASGETGQASGGSPHPPDAP